MDIQFIFPNNDLSAVVSVLNESHGTVAKEFGFTKETNPTNNAFIDKSTLRHQLLHGIQLYALTLESRWIGCIAIEKSQKEVDTYYIEKVSVMPAFRNQGFGVQLMEFATQKIKSLGGKIISIALIDSNARLKNWYIKQGFEETAVRDFTQLPFRVCFMSKNI
jgi:ribosomal protein S18 acetylase RimI-like enzyme